jgi:hypothetical protein
VKNKEELAPPAQARVWTRAEDYLGALSRRRAARKHREPGPRTEPEAPQFSLSTLPFLALIGALGGLALAIMISDFPGSHPQPRPRPAARQQGIAEKGWFQEAQKDFRKSSKS